MILKEEKGLEKERGDTPAEVTCGGRGMWGHVVKQPVQGFLRLACCPSPAAPPHSMSAYFWSCSSCWLTLLRITGCVLSGSCLQEPLPAWAQLPGTGAEQARNVLMSRGQSPRRMQQPRARHRVGGC